MEKFQKEEEIFKLSVDETGKAYMLETARWAKFISLVLIIVQSLMVLVMLLASFQNGFDVSKILGSSLGTAPGLIFLGLYISIILLFFYPLVCLLNFSRKVKPAVQTDNVALFNTALKNLKNMFRFFGIVMILFIAVYGIVLLFMLLAVTRI
jgi:hypothetical protein